MVRQAPRQAGADRAPHAARAGVFALLVRGLSNKAIAAELNLSPKTVEDHRANISTKTGTNGLAQLMSLADGAFD